MSGLKDKTVESHTFSRWGSHSDDAEAPYLTAAAAIGMDRQVRCLNIYLFNLIYFLGENLGG